MRRPLAVALTTAAVLVAAGIPFTRIQFTGVDASVLPDSAAAKQVDTALRTEFPPGRASPLLVAVDAPPGELDELGAYARPAGVARPTSPPSRRRASSATARWLVEVVPTAPALDTRALELVDAVRAGPAPGPVRVAGESARFVDQRAGLGHRLPLAIAVLAITTLLILFVMTGSVVLPLKALRHERPRAERRLRRARARSSRTGASMGCSTTRARARSRSRSRSCCWRSRSG